VSPRLAVAALLLCAAAPGAALAQRQGAYDVAGTAPDGARYEGAMVMRQVGLSSWQVLWQIGDSRIEGYAMSSGNTFAIGYTIGPRPGIGIYNVLPDGSLTGQWTLIGSSAIGTETLTPRADGGPPSGGLTPPPNTQAAPPSTQAAPPSTQAAPQPSSQAAPQPGTQAAPQPAPARPATPNPPPAPPARRP